MSKAQQGAGSRFISSDRHLLAASLASFKSTFLRTKRSSVKSHGEVSETPKSREKKRSSRERSLEQDSDEVRRDVSILDLKESDIPDNSSLNRTLTQRLKDLGPDYNIELRFLVFQDMFASVIALDSQFSILLKRIKAGYEEHIANISRTDAIAENKELHKQMNEFHTILEQELSEKIALKTMLEVHKEELAKKEAVLKTMKNRWQDEIAKSRQAAAHLQIKISLLQKRESELLSMLQSVQRRNCQVEERRVQSLSETTDFLQTSIQPSLDCQFDEVSPISPIRRAAHQFPDSDSLHRN